MPAPDPDAQNTLLSFLYNVSFNKVVYKAFHESNSKVFEHFQLSPAMKDVLTKLGEIPTSSAPRPEDDPRRPLMQQLTDLLRDELLTELYRTFW